MLVYFARAGARHPLIPVALGLLLGGSLSNLADRVRQGYVTDFIDPEYWPAFNLGDVFITVGVIALLVTLLFFDKRSGLNRRSPVAGRWPPSRLPCRRKRQASGSIASRGSPGGRIACGGRASVRVRVTSWLTEWPSRRAPGWTAASLSRSRCRSGESPSLEPEQLELGIAYEDERLLVVDKPAGIVVHPGAGHASGTLVHGLLGAWDRWRRGPNGPASSTASTATPRASSWSPATRRPTDGFRRWCGPGARRASTWRSSAAGLAPGAAASRRHRPRPPGSERVSLDTDRRARRSPTRGDRVAGGARVPPRSARNGPDPSDPRASRGDRSSRLRRSRVRRRRDLGLRGSSCTPPASRSPTRSTGAAVDVESPLPADLAAALDRARA